MNIVGKFVIFVEDKQTSKGKIKTFNTSISHKNEDGSYTNARMEVRFAKENFPLERINKLVSTKCYTFEVIEAWLDCRAFQTKDGKDAREIFLSIKQANPVESKDVVHAHDVRADF